MSSLPLPCCIIHCEYNKWVWAQRKKIGRAKRAPSAPSRKEGKGGIRRGASASASGSEADCRRPVATTTAAPIGARCGSEARRGHATRLSQDKLYPLTIRV